MAAAVIDSPGLRQSQLSVLQSHIMGTAEIIAEVPRLSSAELAQVEAKLRELVEPERHDSQNNSAPVHPALGIWKDRNDLA